MHMWRSLLNADTFTPSCSTISKHRMWTLPQVSQCNCLNAPLYDQSKIFGIFSSTADTHKKTVALTYITSPMFIYVAKQQRL